MSYIGPMINVYHYLLLLLAANTYDMKVTISVLDNILVKRLSSNINKKKNRTFILIRGYDFQEIENKVIKKGYLPDIRDRGEQVVLTKSFSS